MSSEAECEVVVPADMTIYEAEEIKGLFSNALKEEKNISVNLANVAEIDSAGIQLMVALKKEAKESNKTVHYTSHSKAVINLFDLFDISSHFGDPIVLEK